MGGSSFVGFALVSGAAPLVPEENQSFHERTSGWLVGRFLFRWPSWSGDQGRNWRLPPGYRPVGGHLKKTPSLSRAVPSSSGPRNPVLIATRRERTCCHCCCCHCCCCHCCCSQCTKHFGGGISKPSRRIYVKTPPKMRFWLFWRENTHKMKKTRQNN